MGRAERRQRERTERIESRKGKVLVEKHALSELKRKTVSDTAAFDTEALMTCFALTGRRLHGYGKTRILRELQYVDELMGPILSGEKTVNDYKRELEQEIGLVIKCEAK